MELGLLVFFMVMASVTTICSVCCLVILITIHGKTLGGER